MRVRTLNRLLNTPKSIKALTISELNDFCETILRIVNLTDYEVVSDLMRDRNEFRDCYNKLTKQLQGLGVEPCIDYYSYRKGKKKNV